MGKKPFGFCNHCQSNKSLEARCCRVKKCGKRLERRPGVVPLCRSSLHTADIVAWAHISLRFSQPLPPFGVCVPRRETGACKVNAKDRGQKKKERSRGRDRKTMRRFYNRIDSGGSRWRGTTREKQSGGEKAVGFRSVWIAELCTHSGLSLSSSPPPCLLKSGILFLSAGIPCLSGYFHSCPLYMCTHVCVVPSGVRINTVQLRSSRV